MSRVIIEVPDMGEVDDVEVVELLVAPGEHVDKDQSLLVLESDKASVEIPSTIAGVVNSVIVSMGDRVVTGAPLIEIETLEEEGANQTELAVEEGVALREQHAHHHVVLDQPAQRPPVGRRDVLLVRRGLSLIHI